MTWVIKNKHNNYAKDVGLNRWGSKADSYTFSLNDAHAAMGRIPTGEILEYKIRIVRLKPKAGRPFQMMAREEWDEKHPVCVVCRKCLAEMPAKPGESFSHACPGVFAIQSESATRRAERERLAGLIQVEGRNVRFGAKVVAYACGDPVVWSQGLSGAILAATWPLPETSK